MIIDDNLVEQEDLIANYICDYYQNLYKEGNVVDNQIILESVEPLVTEHHNVRLIELPTEVEIYGTIRDMSLGSAPGPAGFGGAFFKDLLGDH